MAMLPLTSFSEVSLHPSTYITVQSIFSIRVILAFCSGHRCTSSIDYGISALSSKGFLATRINKSHVSEGFDPISYLLMITSSRQPLRVVDTPTILCFLGQYSYSGPKTTNTDRHSHLGKQLNTLTIKIGGTFRAAQRNLGNPLSQLIPIKINRT